MGTARFDTDLNMGGKKITNGAAGVAASDFAVVSQLPAAGAVSSVFGRTGAVVAATNDYSEAQLSFTDITTNDVSTTKHGFTPKLPNDSTKYLDGTGAYTVPPGTGGTGLLALFVQTAGTNKTTTSATQADVDATNAVVTFSAPASGNVLVRVTCHIGMSANFQNGRLGLRESTTDVAGPYDAIVGTAAQTTFQTHSLAFRVAGISAGSHTYKLAFAVSGGATLTVLQIGSGGTIYPVTMEVWAAP